MPSFRVHTIVRVHAFYDFEGEDQEDVRRQVSEILQEDPNGMPEEVNMMTDSEIIYDIVELV